MRLFSQREERACVATLYLRLPSAAQPSGYGAIQAARSTFDADACCVERGAMTFAFSAKEDFARQLDAEDSLRHFREKFHLPHGENGKPLIYFAGNSLGLMPKAARKMVEQEMDN